MRVYRADLERRLADVESQIGDPRAGVWGPSTTTWKLDRELLNFAGGGRAALLQLAHPFVARAIAEHSSALEDPRGRFRRTFAQMFAMTFGDLQTAFSAARRVHAVHARIRGRLDESIGSYPQGARYFANESSALLWVHATLIDTVLVVHDRLGGGVSEADKERYYQESKRGAALFGIPHEEIPRDYPAFQSYFEDRLEDGTIAVSGAARAIAHGLLAAPTPALAPLAGVYRLITSGLLPAPIRAGYGFPFGPAERLGYRTALSAARAAYRAAPRQAKLLPAYTHAARRVGIDDGGGLARAVERALVSLDFWPQAAS